MPFLATIFRWFGTCIGLPLFKWLIGDLLIPFITNTLKTIKENAELKKKLKEVQDAANAKADQYEQNPTSDNFNNLP